MGASKREAKLDARLRRKLQDFERALVEAISESDEASRVLEELRGEGFALYLLLDGSGDGLKEALKRRGELPPTAVPMPPRRALPPAPPESRGEPAFRINGRDLAFLRSVGIDPTRTLRRRRTARSAHRGRDGDSG